MHDIPVLRDLLLIAGASLAVVLVFQRLRLPPTIGFIVTGILIGPGGLALVRDAGFVQTMAEIGVVLLLFTVGLEFSLTDLRRLGRTVIVGGGLQVLLTLGAVALGLIAFGMHPARAIFLGMLAALSSTAVVLKLLTDRHELESPHGRLATAVLIFQDLIAVLFLLAVPALGGWLGEAESGGIRGPSPSPFAAAIVIGLFVLLFAGGQRALRWLFALAARSRSREAFLFGVVLVAIGSAWLAAWAGLSLALGAFLAGLLLAESDFREQVAADVLPFRDTLASVFFVSLGMSFLPASVIEDPGLVFSSAILLVVIKLFAGVMALRLAGSSWRVGFAAALALAQIGEFSFMIAQAGTPYGLFTGPIGQAFFASAVFSLMLTPLLVARAPDWALQLEIRLAAMRSGSAAVAGARRAEADTAQSKLMSGHVIIAGFGLNGRNLARVLRSVRVPHEIVDLNADALATEAAEGSEILVGDITRELIQRQAGVTRARVLVLAISDPTATRQACRVARGLSSDVHIIVRTRLVAEIDGLYAIGANQVIPEEFETSIEIFTAVLRDYHVPGNVIDAQIRLLRQERYSLLRGRKLPGSVVEQLETIMAEGTTDTFLLLQHSPAVGRTLDELGLGHEGDCTLIAVVRGGRALDRYDGSLALRVGDTLVMTGNHASMDRLFQRLRPREPEEAAPGQAPSDRA